MRVTVSRKAHFNAAHRLYVKSWDDSKNEKVLPRTTKIASAVGLVYFFLTIVCSFFLYSTGLDFFDSLAHGMTIIATGGFSTKNMSIGFSFCFVFRILLNDCMHNAHGSTPN